MSAYVFLGPSLPLREARAILPGAIFLPPARQGDIWRVTEFGGPRVIGLIDGYFESVPSVWHKEILWALSQGIAVVGSSSMGALRAAELDRFGMVGVGVVYGAYRDGFLPPYVNEDFEDDDEVAMVHGPPESGYLASDAMVNIRCTLARASDEGVISASDRDALVSVAKKMFYKDRFYSAVLERAEQVWTLADSVSALKSWLPSGRVDQKRSDARDLLDWIKNNDHHRPDVKFHFEPTTMWRQLIADTPRNSNDELVLRELRLSGESYVREWDAMARKLTREIAGKSELDLKPDEVTPMVTAAGLDCAVAQAALMRRTAAQTAPLVDVALLTRLKDEGGYDTLLKRAEEKKRLLGTVGAERTTSNAGLLGWFRPRMGDYAVDPDAVAAVLGFPSEDDFLSALADEYLFVQVGEGNVRSK
jgi:hypothetical protein